MFSYGNCLGKHPRGSPNSGDRAVGAVPVAPLAGVAEKMEETVILSGLGLVGGFCPYVSPVCVMEE